MKIKSNLMNNINIPNNNKSKYRVNEIFKTARIHSQY